MVKVKLAKSLAEAIEVIQADQETNLDIHSHARIGDEGATQLATALKTNLTLQVLIAGGQEIGPEGAKALGEGLRKHPKLQELHLPKNKLGYEGLEKMALELAEPIAKGSSVPGNKIIKLLGLSKNEIGPHCGNCQICRLAPEFPMAIFDLSSLEIVDLNGNEVSTLPWDFAKMPKLVGLDIRNNPLGNIPETVFLTARQGHASGWPLLKEFMLKEIDRELNPDKYDENSELKSFKLD